MADLVPSVPMVFPVPAPTAAPVPPPSLPPLPNLEQQTEQKEEQKTEQREEKKEEVEPPKAKQQKYDVSEVVFLKWFNRGTNQATWYLGQTKPEIRLSNPNSISVLFFADNCSFFVDRKTEMVWPLLSSGGLSLPQDMKMARSKQKYAGISELDSPVNNWIKTHLSCVKQMKKKTAFKIGDLVLAYSSGAGLYLATIRSFHVEERVYKTGKVRTKSYMVQFIRDHIVVTLKQSELQFPEDKKIECMGKWVPGGNTRIHTNETYLLHIKRQQQRASNLEISTLRLENKKMTDELKQLQPDIEMRRNIQYLQRQKLFAPLSKQILAFHDYMAKVVWEMEEEVSFAWARWKATYYMLQSETNDTERFDKYKGFLVPGLGIDPKLSASLEELVSSRSPSSWTVPVKVLSLPNVVQYDTKNSASNRLLEDDAKFLQSMLKEIHAHYDTLKASKFLVEWINCKTQFTEKLRLAQSHSESSQRKLKQRDLDGYLDYESLFLASTGHLWNQLFQTRQSFVQDFPEHRILPQIEHFVSDMKSHVTELKDRITEGRRSAQADIRQCMDLRLALVGSIDAQKRVNQDKKAKLELEQFELQMAVERASEVLSFKDQSDRIASYQKFTLEIVDCEIAVKQLTETQAFMTGLIEKRNVALNQYERWLTYCLECVDSHAQEFNHVYGLLTKEISQRIQSYEDDFKDLEKTACSDVFVKRFQSLVRRQTELLNKQRLKEKRVTQLKKDVDEAFAATDTTCYQQATAQLAKEEESLVQTHKCLQLLANDMKDMQNDERAKELFRKVNLLFPVEVPVLPPALAVGEEPLAFLDNASPGCIKRNGDMKRDGELLLDFSCLKQNSIPSTPSAFGFISAPVVPIPVPAVPSVPSIPEITKSPGGGVDEKFVMIAPTVQDSMEGDASPKSCE